MLRFHKQEAEEGMNLTPLIDVIFILLIFFMISTQFKSYTLPLELPEAGNTSSPELNDPLQISIDEEGLIYVEDRIVALEEMRQAVALEFSKNPDLVLVLDCHRETVFEKVLMVLSEVKDAGVSNIHFRHETLRD
ncbi:MAG: biopolymer transporter ExbD [Spirochaetales bacterium]|nr:biopolymer transporter ExbD [Spirochaetales bacterium]